MCDEGHKPPKLAVRSSHRERERRASGGTHRLVQHLFGLGVVLAHLWALYDSLAAPVKGKMVSTHSSLCRGAEPRCVALTVAALALGVAATVAAATSHAALLSAALASAPARPMRSRWVCSQSSCAPSGGHSCWHSCWHSSARHRSCSTARSACRPTIWTWLGRLGDLQFASTLLPRPNAWPATSCCDRLLWMPLGQWEWTTCWRSPQSTCSRSAIMGAFVCVPQCADHRRGGRHRVALSASPRPRTALAKMLDNWKRRIQRRKRPISSCLKQQQQQQQQQPLNPMLRRLLSIQVGGFPWRGSATSPTTVTARWCSVSRDACWTMLARGAHQAGTNSFESTGTSAATRSGTRGQSDPDIPLALLTSQVGGLGLPHRSQIAW